MSKNSKNISKTEKAGVKLENLSKPFSQSVLIHAQKISRAYHLILEEHDRLGFTANCVEIPTVFANGQSANECVKAIRKALTYTVATMIESKDATPQPFSDNKRDTQVNVRLTYGEKLLLNSESKKLGFTGLSDFIRTSVLNHIHCKT